MTSRPSIAVLAGTNGAGKSSVAGASIRERGWHYFNPDEVSRRIREADSGVGVSEATALAWVKGRNLLEAALQNGRGFAFETTLGGNTIPELLERAAAGFAVRIWYVGLESPELHIARVKARVAEGGHDIPEAKIRERYDRSRENLIRLMPGLAELWIYDNSDAGDFAAGIAPAPRLILHARDGVVRETCGVEDVPTWAKPLFVAALRQYSI